MKNLFDADEDYIKKYIEKYALYYVNGILYVLDRKSEYFNMINEIIKTGVSKIPNYEGDWYELQLSRDIHSFNYFYYTFNIKKQNKLRFSEINFKRFEHDGCYKSKFLGSVKIELTENAKWKWEDLTKEELEELTESSRKNPFIIED